MPNFCSVRIRPLKSKDFTSSKYSLKKAIQHDTRQYDENHVDKSRSKFNIISDDFSYESFCEKIEEIKKEFPMIQKNSTIDVVNFIFSINKQYFDSEEKKQLFYKNIEQFLEKELGSKKAILGIVAHDDEDGFHIHAYGIPLHKTLKKNRFSSEEKVFINYRGKYAHTQAEINEFRKTCTQEQSKTGQLQTRFYESIKDDFPDVLRGMSNTGKTNITPKQYREIIDKKMPKIQDDINSMKRESKALQKSIDTLSLEKDILETSINNESQRLDKITDKNEELIKDNIKLTEENKILDEKNTSIKEEISTSERERDFIQKNIDFLSIEKDRLKMTVENEDKKLTQLIKDNKEMKETNKKLHEEIVSLIDKKYQIENDISDIEKEKINMFREISISHVLKLFGKNSCPAFIYDDKGRKRNINNPIDYLIYIEKLPYTGAIKFLSDNFNEIQLGKTVKKSAGNFETPVPASIQLKVNLIKKQFELLEFPTVRIHASKKEIINGERKETNINLGLEEAKTLYGEERETREIFYNVNNVLKYIPKLNYYNSQGFDIYITPIEYNSYNGKKFAILVDDVNTKENIEKILTEVGIPNLCLETSSNNYQFVYLVDNIIDYSKTTKKLGNEKERKIYTELFNYLNRKYGDKNITCLRHAIRLAGYANKKPQRNDEFIKLKLFKEKPHNNLMERLKEIISKNSSKNYQLNFEENNTQNSLLKM